MKALMRPPAWIRAAAMLAAIVVGAAAADPERSAAAAPPTYDARYQVEYNGRKVGMSEFSVNYDPASGHYRFESRTTASGLFKLLRPHPAVQRSDFVLRDGMIKPLEFRFEDGSRRGEDNVHIVFDWSRGVAALTSEAGDSELPVQPGVLDLGTVQVALMRDLALDRQPGPYTLLEDAELKTYRYTSGAQERLEVGSGTYDTLVLTQRREGSSRTTLLWVAPELSYLPVKIEQRRDGKVQTSFTLTSVDGI